MLPYYFINICTAAISILIVLGDEQISADQESMFLICIQLIGIVLAVIQIIQKSQVLLDHSLTARQLKSKVWFKIVPSLICIGKGFFILKGYSIACQRVGDNNF